MSSIFVELLREKIEKYRISQKDLAEVANRSETNISQILTGKTNPKLEGFETLLDACDRLKPGFKEDYLRSLAGNKLDLQQFVYSLNSVEFGMLLMVAGQRVQDKQSQPMAIAS